MYSRCHVASLICRQFLWSDVQFEASTRCHTEYHIEHSGIDRSSLQYSYTLLAKVRVSKLVIIIDSYVIKSWFTFANMQSVSIKLPRAEIFYFPLHFVFEWPFHSYTFAHSSNIACLPAGRINTHRDILWKLKMLYQTEKCLD